jgi:hypothetical protein
MKSKEEKNIESIINANMRKAAQFLFAEILKENKALISKYEYSILLNNYLSIIKAAIKQNDK